MSFKLGGIVIEDLVRGISAHEKLILAAYASFAFKDGSRIWAGQETVAQLALCSPRMVRKALDKFLGQGVLVKTGKVRRTPEYRLDIERALELYGRPKKAAPGAGKSEDNAAHGSGSIPAPDSKVAAPGDEKAAHGSGNPGNPGENPSAAGGDEAERAAAAGRALADAIAFWKGCQAKLRDRVDEAAFKSWIEPIYVRQHHGNRLVLAMPSDFMRGWVIEHYAELIAEVSGCEVEVIVWRPRDAG